MLYTALYEDHRAGREGVSQNRMRDGRLQQITEHIDRIEHELSDVQELVARMQEDDREQVVARDSQLPREPSVTSACWPNSAVIVQEDSASL